MYKISNDVQKAAKLLNIDIVNIDKETYIKIILNINKKYIQQNSKNILIWEKLINPQFISDVNGWRSIKNFIKDQNCILFFNNNDDKNAYILQNGKDLNDILSETSGFEFYITNMETDYLICFNHHDYLFGCGTARDWINSLI